MSTSIRDGFVGPVGNTPLIRLRRSNEEAANFVDTAIDDPTCVKTAYRLRREAGHFVGGATGINAAAAIQVARQFGRGHPIVALLRDRGTLYPQRPCNAQSLQKKGLSTE